MKLSLCVTAALMLASSALAQTPAAGPEADADIGQTKCEVEVAGEMVDDICEFDQECHTSTNKTHSKCIPKGNVACSLYSKRGTEGDVIAVTSCKPYQTCCDGACCNTGEQCIEAYSDGSGQEVNNPPLTFSYDYSMPLTLEQAARNGWKTRRGVEIKNKPRVCGTAASNPKFEDTAGYKAIQVPLLCLFIVFVVFVQTIRKSQEGLIDMIPPLAVIGSSFLLVLSSGWKMSLMATFVSAATAAAGADKRGWVVLFQVFFLWFYYGGSVGVMFLSGGSLDNFFKEAGSYSLKDLSQRCSTYFNYYKLDHRQLAWDQDQADNANIYTGLCSVGFQGILVFCVYIQATMLFLMTTLTTVSYLNPSDEDSKETKNPAAQVEMSQ